MRVKIVFGKAAVVWRPPFHPTTSKYGSLQQFVRDSFDIRTFTMSYLDDEEDFVRILHDDDVEDALQMCNAHQRTSLKIHIDEHEVCIYSKSVLLHWNAQILTLLYFQSECVDGLALAFRCFSTPPNHTTNSHHHLILINAKWV